MVFSKSHHSGVCCLACHNFLINKGAKSKNQSVKKRANTLRAVVGIMFKPMITADDVKAMTHFIRSKEADLSEAGMQLKGSVKAQLDFYRIPKV